ncbi:DUF6454 family protein [Pseudonocardia xinjiangensis]|uniref:Uncharacterized protein n=1 Tax=Pseudonocardia xinjiangensis TaxID=75289 RepID=A0ABX1R7E6_9PSEU|nr:DUF6454 family protein [Pseudonocardia xinjiangensis]NMH76307.1 hypothetical protein [Pseudonocardia xinjiangensis]
MGRRSRLFGRGAAAAVLAVLALLPGAGGAAAAPSPGPGPASSAGDSGGDLASDLAAVDRSTAWTQLSTVKLNFPTYHPEGLVVTADRFYLSSTQIIEPTQTYPAPVDGFDRTPGKGVGHLFVIDRTGKLLKDVVLGHGDVYHPGGIDLHGNDLWVPVAQYRPGSTAEIDRVDIRTLEVTRAFTVDDHIGGIVYDASTGHLVGNNWGSRTFYEWTPSGKPVTTWKNPENLVDFQDCQYVPKGKMACGGITNLPQTPTAGGAKATYELGGIALLDLRTHAVVNEFPFQQWSAAGHVMTRNPLKLSADGDGITMWAAPDNGEESAGTQIYTWQAKVPKRS